ncbi:uncharacterized protein I206_103417 [Kwoniella pini CBS 10737]|uniref:Chromo domain-containing protein n=1 Tax=Kwoniella pini CBS 10737 TaxID=1296096 RepID=A0A1B9I9K5_9TREE|nr:uncharacterized protein I206_01579 [Kwoniella pini CBS 10737]OCF52292.1 hypothetical protein I206_01579 [Kwoniella pini CBS 10737]
MTSMLAFLTSTSPEAHASTSKSSSSSKALSMPPPEFSGIADGVQLPTPTSSVSYNGITNYQNERQSTNSSTSIRRRGINSPTPTPQPSQSFTQELFRITQLLLSLDSDTRKSVKETEFKLENLEDLLGNKLKSFESTLDGIKNLLEEGEISKVELKNSVEILNGRIENIERMCRSISRSQSFLENGTSRGIQVGRSRSHTREQSSSINQLPVQPDMSGLRIDKTSNTFGHRRADDQSNFDTFIDDNSGNDGVDEANDLDLSMEMDDDFQPPDMNNESQTPDMNNKSHTPDMINELHAPDIEIGVDPQEIMRSPSQGLSSNAKNHTYQADGGQQEKSIRQKVAAVIARENELANTVHLSPVDDLNDAPLQEIPSPSYQTRSRRKSSLHPPIGSPHLSHASSSTIFQVDDHQESGSSSKPPPRLPFPPRGEPVSSPSTQTRKRGRPRISLSQTKGGKSHNRPISVDSKSSGSVQEIDDEDFTPRKKKRRKSMLKSNVVKDEKKPHDYSKYTKAGTARIRKFKGQVRLAIKCLAPSDGSRLSEATWPDKGPNTARGRLEEIICDACKGRCHWSCSGIPEDKDMSSENWICPDCAYRIEVEDTPRILIESTQQLKCIRYNCILREKRAIEHQEGEEERYFVEKIVGRQAIAREPDSQKRVFLYLVKWDGYELNDCTWEPPAHLEHHIDRLLAEFDIAAKRTKSNTKARVCILPEARKYWDENTGEPVAQILQEESSGTDELNVDHRDPIDESDNITQDSPEKAMSQISYDRVTADDPILLTEQKGDDKAPDPPGLEQNEEDEEIDELDDDQEDQQLQSQNSNEEVGGLRSQGKADDEATQGERIVTEDNDGQEGEDELVDELEDTDRPVISDEAQGEVGEQTPEQKGRSFFGIRMF